MTTIGAVLGLAAILAGWWIYRRRRAHHVTPLWLIVNERREWQSGIDQSRITWPIRRNDNRES